MFLSAFLLLVSLVDEKPPTPNADSTPNLTALGDGVIREEGLYHVVSRSDTPVLAIETRAELTGHKHQKLVLTFELPSGEQHVMKDYLSLDGTLDKDFTWHLPNGERLSFHGLDGYKRGRFVFGKHHFEIDPARALRPQFESEKGQAFRSILPAEGREIAELIWDVRAELEQQHVLGTSSPFLFAGLYMNEEVWEKGMEGSKQKLSVKKIRGTKKKVEKPAAE